MAIAFARNFASGLIQNAEPVWQQEGTTLTDEELDIVQEELERIAQSLESRVNQEMLAKVKKEP